MSTERRMCCALAKRADIGAITAALVAGLAVRKVASTFGVNKTDVGKHRNQCLRLDDPRPRGDDAVPADVEPPKKGPPVPPSDGAAEVPMCDRCGNKRGWQSAKVAGAWVPCDLCCVTAAGKPDDDGVAHVVPTVPGVPLDVLDEARRELAADKAADSGQRADSVRSAGGKREAVSDSKGGSANLVREPMDPTLAQTDAKRAEVCADMVAAGRWQGRATVRMLCAVWGVSPETVRKLHWAGTLWAEADRGHVEAVRENSIGAFQAQEEMALEAYRASMLMVTNDEGGGGEQLGMGDAKLLMVAVKARENITKLAGCIQPAANSVVVINTPQFTAAATENVGTLMSVLADVDALATEAGVPVDAAARLSRAACAILERRIASQLGDGKRLPAIDVDGEAV